MLLILIIAVSWLLTSVAAGVLIGKTLKVLGKGPQP